MSFPSHIFRSYDIRGLLDEVTPELAEKAGAIFAKKTGAKKVVVGRDMRATSPELMTAAIRGVTSVGVEAIDIGMTTTSLFNYCFSSFGEETAGMMITASHNPAKYNGLKFYDCGNLPVSGKIMKDWVEEEIILATTSGTVTKKDLLNDYLTQCLSLSGQPNFSGVKVVVDYGNGVGVITVRALLEKLGVTTLELYPEPDANFPNHEANPAKEETMNDLKAAVVKENAVLGIALDGDVDRTAFVDNEGKSLGGDLLLALLSRELLGHRAGAKIVVSPNQSWATFDSVAENGGQIISCPIGRTNILATMKKEAADLGGEVSGHFFWKEFSDLESVDYTIIKVLDVWKKSGQTFADLVRPLRRYHNSGEVNLEIEDRDIVIKKLEDKYVSQATTVERMDGIRCEFNRDWWFIARLSNTEPILRLTVEAKSEELMQEKVEELKKVINE
ncbi:MAG: phosphomannomutase/phosphoglucomutase [Patescibacteria group bacterium]|jgi:phosphomannomutase